MYVSDNEVEAFAARVGIKPAHERFRGIECVTAVNALYIGVIMDLGDHTTQVPGGCSVVAAERYRIHV